MKNIEKYTDPNITEQELHELTGKLLRAKFIRDKKQKWAEILEKEHDIRRGGLGDLQVVSRSPLRKWLLVAASLLLPILLYFWLWRPYEPSPAQLADVFLSQEKIPEPQTRKGDIQIEALAQQATEAYNEGKYDQAIALWEQLEGQNSMASDDYFFKAISHLRLDQLEKAIADFQRIRSRSAENPKFQQETTWLLALSYLKAGQLGAAKEELQQVVRDGWRTEKARQLLELLAHGH